MIPSGSNYGADRQAPRALRGAGFGNLHLIAQHARNYAFFDAPVGLIFSIDRDLEKGSWLDYGMFLQSIMVAARGFEFETCPQAAWLAYWDVLQRRLGIPAEQTILCGMAMGYPDPNEKVNAFTPDRMPAAECVTFVKALNE